MWQKLVYLSLAGGIGTLARYGLSGLVQRWGDQVVKWLPWCEGFPWGTLSVNILGCFLFGLVWSLAESRLSLDSQAKLIVLTGFMGAFTTFSTFGFESAQMWLEGQRLMLLANLLMHNGLGLTAVWVGFVLGRV
ncbi:MAG: CrcB family protein [Acidobacteria bacterium]|nr:CrcB family protein [Acidobacteriota bacterium]